MKPNQRVHTRQRQCCEPLISLWGPLNHQRRIALLLILLLETGLVGPAVVTHAADADAFSESETRHGYAYEPSAAGELMFFADIPLVISASRRAEPLNQSPVAISVITGEEIRESGMTNLYEILQFRPGVDMLAIDRNRYALGIRGLHEAFSDRTLTLIDGRAADSPMFGGSELLRLPVDLADIERVEIVRGPGGAIWGANAFNGVINIITKDPDPTLQSRVSTTLNEYGDHAVNMRWAAGTAHWDWRISMGYLDEESSDDAVKNDHFVSRDFHRNYRVDGEALLRISDRDTATFGLGYSTISQGDFETFGTIPMADGELNTVRGFARLERKFAIDSRGYVQWFGNYGNNNWPGLQHEANSWENDLELQYDFKVGDDHNLSMGGNVRTIHLSTGTPRPNEILFPDEPLHEEWTGLFVVDQWTISDRLTLETQVRGDYYSETHPDWSGRVSALYAMDDSHRHILRLSGARSFRAPLAALREIETRRGLLPSPPFPPDTYSLTVVRPQDVDNEGITSLESGYSGQLTETISVGLNGYLQKYDELLAFTGSQVTPFTIVSTVTSPGDATAGGVECEMTVKHELGTVTIWYALNEFHTENRDQAVRAYRPARHKAGVNGRFRLPSGCFLNLHYKYTDTTPGTPEQNNRYPAFHRLDLSVSKSWQRDRFEWLIGVSDLLDDTGFSVKGINNVIVAHETPGRTFFSRLAYNF